MKNKMFLPLVLSLLIVSCSDSKPYNAYICDKSGSITDTVLDVYRKSKDLSSQYTVISVHIGKSDSGAKDVTLSLTDVVGYMNNNQVSPLTFAESINTWGDGSEMYNYTAGTSTTFTVKRNEEHGTFPDCIVCFEKGAIDKNVVIKIKGQEINHNANDPTKINL